jgi:hypothetical protein
MRLLVPGRAGMVAQSLVTRKPNMRSGLLLHYRYCGAVFGEAVGRDQAAAFRLQPASPVRRGRVADIGDGRAAGRAAETAFPNAS